MYLPKHFEAGDPALALEVMRKHNFALLVGTDDDGRPYATHLPMIVSERGAEGARRIVLEGHVAKPNPQARFLSARPEVMVVFSGPQAYMSPKVYPDLQRVPTWNYVAVHAYGRVALIEGEAKKDALLKGLIAIHEPEYAAQWRGLPQEFQSKMMAGIVAFEIEVQSLEAKFKLNQHRKEAHAAMKARYASGTADERALGEWMVRLGL
ncbi:MAG: FMN-binding negative transcriptional regulator [Burkholderiales bacterium]|nr:FMN-binding negative transcriptional regulator [Burkholderiales bacterium]